VIRRRRFALLDHHLGGLASVGCGADAEVEIGLRKGEFVEKHRGEFGIVMLSGMNQHFLVVVL